MDPVDLSLGDAAGYIITWRHATGLQALRLLSEDTGMPEGPYSREVDCHLFAVSLRNVLRAVDLAERVVVAYPEQAEKIRDARSVFSAEVPHAKDLRDVLEHFDHYASGGGRLRKKDAPPFPVMRWTERDGSTHRLWLGVPPRPPMQLDIRVARDAAHLLASETLEALDQADARMRRRALDD
ncbi:MAG TPA: hypothetical protein VEI83_11955 [Acidimicrobiales bacterium]|nr:hypothetical protein [Acidimicrobiales bacterium]